MKQYLYNGKVVIASSKKQVIKIVASNEKVIAESKEHLKDSFMTLSKRTVITVI